MGGHLKEEGGEKELNITKNSKYLYKSEIYIYKNIPSSCFNEECFSLQIVLLNHYNTKPTHRDSSLIH